MLKLSNITKQYTLGGSAVNALRGVDLEFRENEFVSILGPSGCGKTTTLILVAIFYLGGELWDAIFVDDNISQLTHIIGGVCGTVLGFILSDNR